MKLRSLVPALIFSLSTIAHAQTGLYMNPIAIHVTNPQVDTGAFAFLGENSTSQIFYGVNFGGYYNFHHTKPVDIGFDMRDSIVRHDGASLNSFLVGLRVSGKPGSFPVKLYLQPMFGSGTTKPALTTIHKTNFEYSVLAGVDYPLRKHIDFRVIELGYGSVTTINSEDFGSAASVPASHLVTISTGFVFYFGH